jgi:hypothetical protein
MGRPIRRYQCTCPKAESNIGGKSIFAFPIATIHSMHLIQQMSHIGDANCIGGERRCKITLPLSSNAYELGGARRGAISGARPQRRWSLSLEADDLEAERALIVLGGDGGAALEAWQAGEAES